MNFRALPSRWKYLLGQPLIICGRTIHILGLVLVTCSIYAIVMPPRQLGITWVMVIGLVSLGGAFFGRYIYHIGKRMAAPEADVVIQQDQRNPVLYLRSFIDDDVAARVVKGSTLVPGESTVSTFSLTFSVTTEEEIIAKELERIGPCIAVGRRNERLPPLGMARMYFDGEHWQDGVRELMQRAELVIMRAGITEGFLVELRMAVKFVNPKKVIIILPYEMGSYQGISQMSEGYIKFREVANSILPKPLPMFSGEGMPGTSLSGIVSFQADWTPRTLALFAVGSTLNETFESISKRYANYGTI